MVALAVYAYFPPGFAHSKINQEKKIDGYFHSEWQCLTVCLAPCLTTGFKLTSQPLLRSQFELICERMCAGAAPRLFWGVGIDFYC